MLMPYLILYRLSKWLSLTQGKLSQPKQYLTLAFTIFSQFLIRHATQDVDLWLSSPRQPGHGFLSLVYARQRRQFIPQGAISFVEIAVVFVDLFDAMSRSRRGYVSTSLLKPNNSVTGARPRDFRKTSPAVPARPVDALVRSSITTLNYPPHCKRSVIFTCMPASCRSWQFVRCGPCEGKATPERPESQLVGRLPHLGDFRYRKHRRQ